MQLPIEISPNPLINSSIEIRFESPLKDEEVLGFFYPIFSTKFPILKERRIPVEFKRNDIQLRYAASYIFSNDKYSIFIDNNVIAFENVNSYQLWSNYFPMIKENLNTLSEQKIINKIERVGVRYSSMFDDKHSFSDILTINIVLPYPGYEESNYEFKTELRKDNILLLLQLSQNATVVQGDSQKKGIFIDIDASISHDLPKLINDELFSIIDKLHLEEKKLFFSLLSPSFLKTLNPKYD